MAILTAVVTAVLATGTAADSLADATESASTCVRMAAGQANDCSAGPDLVVKFDGRVAPARLPRHEMTPVALMLSGKVSTNDGTQPSALREATINIDRDVAIDATGLPVCHPFARRGGAPRKICRGATVGGGKADFEIGFVEALPIRVTSHLSIYNGGVRDGVTTIYAIARVDVPLPSTVVIAIKVKKVGSDYGLSAVATIPPIVGGSGSLVDFDLRLKRLFHYRGMRESYATARCPDGEFKAAVSALFRNEAHTPGVPASTVVDGPFALPCTPAAPRSSR